MRKHIVLVGAGHAHLFTISRIPDFIEQGHDVTVIAPEPFHYYSGMGPGLLSAIYRPRQARFHVSRLTEWKGGTFIEDSVVAIDPVRKTLILKKRGEILYDLVSFNTGSRVPEGKIITGHPSVIPAKPVENLFKARQMILEAAVRQPVRLLVVGGGAAGVEIAANASMLSKSANRDINVILISRSQVLNSFLPKARRIALKKLHSLGVTVFENCAATVVKGERLELSDGRCLFFDFIFLAAGILPHDIFRKSNVPVGPDGGLLVDKYLQSAGHPEIFGGGDCISFHPYPLAKVGVYGLREAPVLYHNLLAAASGKPLRPFVPQRKYLLVLNMGDGTGIMHRRPFTLYGKLMFKLKHYIDQRFMNEFQLCGELGEEDY